MTRTKAGPASDAGTIKQEVRGEFRVIKTVRKDG